MTNNNLITKTYKPSGQNRKNKTVRSPSAFLLIRHSIHSYRLLFRRFCPLGKLSYNFQSKITWRSK